MEGGGGGRKKECCLLAHFGDILSGDHYHIHGKRVYKCNDHYRIRASLESGPFWPDQPDRFRRADPGLEIRRQSKRTLHS